MNYYKKLRAEIAAPLLLTTLRIHLHHRYYKDKKKKGEYQMRLPARET